MTTEAAKSSRLDALVLAAGAGTRFGGGKLLAPWRGGRLIDAALAAAFSAPVRAVTVVWGADAAVAQAARDWAARADVDRRLRLVEARAHAQGLSASLKAGAASLTPDSAGAFVFLGDMPRIPVEIFARLTRALETGALAAAPVFAGRRGHPVLLGASLLTALDGLTGDRGAGALLRELGAGLALIETTDDGVVFDIDENGDLA